MKAKWEYYKINEAKVNEIQEKYNINKLLATILVNRDIEDIKTYLEPTRHDFHNPYEMPDMEKAVDWYNEVEELKEKLEKLNDSIPYTIRQFYNIESYGRFQ